MQLKRNILIAAMAAVSATAGAQVTNYALTLGEGGSVDCGPMQELTGLASYSVQMWICPQQWTSGAVVASRGESLSLALGQAEGTLGFAVGGKTMEITSAELKAGSWSQITVVCDNGSVQAWVNGREAAKGTLPAVPASDRNFTLGGGYTGRVDEVRLWKTALPGDFNRFANNTVNIYNPQWGNLVAYYKMDQADCANLVDYKSLEDDGEYNNHGIFSNTGATRTVVDDNPGLPYLINGAYTANERFYDRGISRDQYLLSNDLIILGVESLPDGHVQVVTPNNHAKAEGGVRYLAECDGRAGVASFDGTGRLVAPKRTFTPTVTAGNTDGYTFETWFYIDEWVENAYLFRKETNDGKQGFSVRLGEEGQIFVRCNGVNYGASLGVATGGWHHIGIVPRNTGTPRTTYLFVYDGTGKSATAKLCDGGTDCTPAGIDEAEACLGEGFKGKLDETMIWDMNYDAPAIAAQSKKVPMPGFGVVLTAKDMMKANTCYLYDKEDFIGWSSYSQDNWRDIMASAYDGYRGFTVRISVKSHNGWQSTIASAERRQLFAADLGEIAKGYDGVELDLEWMDGTQTDLGLLAEAIRAALPQGKTLFISCHAYGAYRFPKKNMAAVDGFTFQQYGPQPTFFSWENYVSSTQAFINYGFERSKIMTSYATTTSQGNNGTTTNPVAGVRGGFFDAVGFSADDNSGTLSGYTYYFTGPEQTYRRAAYCVENNLQGIFYWDMGNDVPVSSPYNLAKWASYGLNANIDRVVKSVEVKHSTDGIADVVADSPGKVKVIASGGKAVVSGVRGKAEATVCSASGAVLSRQPLVSGMFDISGLPKGVYIVSITVDGSAFNGKFVK